MVFTLNYQTIGKIKEECLMITLNILQNIFSKTTFLRKCKTCKAQTHSDLNTTTEALLNHLLKLKK